MKRIVLNTIFALTVLVSAAYSVSAEGKDKNNKSTVSVNGQVIDKVTGETLAGVVVKIEEANVVCTTDLDGRFSIQGLEPGTYTLNVSYISYKNGTEFLKIEGSKKTVEVNVKLENR